MFVNPNTGSRPPYPVIQKNSGDLAEAALPRAGGSVGKHIAGGQDIGTRNDERPEQLQALLQDTGDALDIIRTAFKRYLSTV